MYLTIPSAEEIKEKTGSLQKMVDSLSTSTIFKAILTLIIGLILVKISLKFLNRLISKSKLNPTYHSFFRSVSKIVLYSVLFIIVGSSLNIDMSVLVALLSVLGLAFSLAVKDSLGNLAGGLLILVSKPFKKGDFIETDNVSGVVTEIGLIYTKLNTFDNKVINIPNGELSNAKIINFTAETERRLDLEFCTSYEDDISKTKEVLNRIVKNHKEAKLDPPPIIRVCEHGDSAIKFAVKVWVNVDDYWNLYFDLMEEVKIEFDKHGITIPYRQIDITINNKNL